MTTSLKIGTNTLSKNYRENHKINFEIVENRKKRQKILNEKLIADRNEIMEKNREAHKQEVYRTQGKTRLIKA